MSLVIVIRFVEKAGRSENFTFTTPFPIDCNKAEDGLKTTPNSQCTLNVLAVDNPMEYARLALDNEMQTWVDAEDSLEVW